MSLEQIIIRHATSADSATLAAIHCESWRDAYANVLDPAFLAGPIEEDRRRLWEGRFADASPMQTVLLAELANGAAAGFICLYRDHEPSWGSLIDNLHVRPALRGRAIGEKLLRTAVARLEPAEPFHLWVFAANTAGIRFYQRLGGKVAGQVASDMPAARGAELLRMVWRSPASLTPERD